MNKELARKVLNELNRKLLLLSTERKSAKRLEIISSILAEEEGVSIEQQGEEKQLKLLLEIDKK